MKNMKEVEILEDELPRRLVDLNQKLVAGAEGIDRDNINASLNRAFRDIEDILVNGYRYQSRDVERVLDDIFSETRENLYHISRSGRTQEIDDKLQEIYTSTKKSVRKYVEIEEESEGKDINRLSNEIKYGAENISMSNSSKERSAERRLEDEIALEMKNKIKSKLRVYDDPRGEEAFSEISSYINRRLMQDVIEKYQEGSKQIGSKMTKEVERIVEDVKQEYNSELAKFNEQEEKKEDKLGLSELVNTPEEAAKSNEEREEGKVQDEKQKEDPLDWRIV